MSPACGQRGQAVTALHRLTHVTPEPVLISRIDLRARTAAQLTRTVLDGVLPRAAFDVSAALEKVRPICEDVRHRGGEAVREYTKRFDAVDLATTRIPQVAIDQALEALDPDVRTALEEAIRRARVVHEAQLPAQSDTTPAAGLTVSTRYVPVGRAGVYVPGGLVAYPSSVVMNVVPAQASGVEQVIVASPPQRHNNGLPHQVILAAQGVVGTDGEAGPTEIAIIADHTADPRFVAADLIGQAEHDENAGCLLITTDPALPGKVDEEVARQLETTRHRERVETALRGQAGYVVADDLDAAIAISDAWAPEHLEIQTEGAAKVATRIRNAGAIFIGSYTPVSLGDYLAGSNHVLPTGGTSRHTSGLSVHPYLRVVNVIECDEASLRTVAPHVDALGGAEDLAAHVAAVRVRVPREEASQ